MGYFITFSIGVLLLWLSYYLASQTFTFIKAGHRVMGVVDEVVMEKGSKGRTYYRPIFKFTTTDGREIRHRYDTSSSSPDWEVGEKATIVYKPSDPQDSVVLTYFGAFGWAMMVLVAAVALLIIGGGNYVFKFIMKDFLLEV